MNYVIVLLGVLLLVVIFYMIYSSYFSTASKLSGEIYLMSQPDEIKAVKLNKPDATRYSYGIWLFVNTWPPGFTTGKRTIFYREKDVHLYLDANGGLKVKIKPTALANDGYLLTNNFPIQKWVFIALSIDNTILDVYLDGKLIKSIAIDQVAPGTDEPITFEASGMDAYISNFERITTPIDPQTVWNMYMRGSGSTTTASKMVGNYNLNLTLLKDGALSQKYKLF